MTPPLSPSEPENAALRERERASALRECAAVLRNYADCMEKCAQGSAPTPAPSREAPRWNAAGHNQWTCSKCDYTFNGNVKPLHEGSCWERGEWATETADEAPSQPARAETERIYPCDKCGKLRSKDEGGTTFSVCDECWNAGVAAMTGKTSPARASAEPRWEPCASYPETCRRCRLCNKHFENAVEQDAHETSCWPRSPAAPRGEADPSETSYLRNVIDAELVDRCGVQGLTSVVVVKNAADEIEALRSRASSAPGAGVVQAHMLHPDNDWNCKDNGDGTARIWAGEYANEGEPDLIIDIECDSAGDIAKWIMDCRSLARAKQEHAATEETARDSCGPDAAMSRVTTGASSPSAASPEFKRANESDAATPAPPAETAAGVVYDGACQFCAEPGFNRYVRMCNGCHDERLRRAPAARDEYTRTALALADATAARLANWTDANVDSFINDPSSSQPEIWLALRDFRKARAAKTNKED